MHKDQTRIKNVLLPLIMDAVLSADPKAERDCTVLNRAFLQGPDPLFLMETCPAEFTLLCRHLGLPESEGRDAIEQAHWRGPGVLLPPGETGLPPDFIEASLGDMSQAPLAWRREAVWLFLAAMSDTTEEDYKPEISLLERFQRAMRAGQKFARVMDDPMTTPWVVADIALTKFLKTTVFTLDEAGIPHTDQDVGFYMAYKAGHPVAAVHYGDKIFYGTIPNTTLDDCGVTVDVKVSESYGFIRVDSTRMT